MSTVIGIVVMVAILGFAIYKIYQNYLHKDDIPTGPASVEDRPDGNDPLHPEEEVDVVPDTTPADTNSDVDGGPVLPGDKKTPRNS